MIVLHWQASPRQFASLLPRTLIAIERWATVQGVMQTDAYGPFYDLYVVQDDTLRHLVLRPATLRLGMQKALEDVTDHWAGWENELGQMFTAYASGRVHEPDFWSESALDFMVQLAWFREVLFQ